MSMEYTWLFVTALRLLCIGIWFVTQLGFVGILLEPCPCVWGCELLINFAQGLLLVRQILPSDMSCMTIVCNVHISIWHIPGASHIPQRVRITWHNASGSCNKVVRFLQVWVFAPVNMVEVAFRSDHVVIIAWCSSFLAKSIG